MKDPMTPLSIDEAEAICRGATSLPWRYGAIEHGGRCLVDARGYVFAQVDDDGNGRFAAYASVALPIALAELRASRGEVEKLREMLEWLDRGGGLGRDVHAMIRKALGKEAP